MLVFEALDSITTVSKTPTKLKIRNSSAFLGSMTKMRVESSKKVTMTAGKQRFFEPTITSTEELCELLEASISGVAGCSFLDATEADGDYGSVSLESCFESDVALLLNCAAANPDPALPTKKQEAKQATNMHSSSEISKALFEQPASAAATPTVVTKFAAASPPCTAHTPGQILGKPSGNHIRDENVSSNVQDFLPTTPTPLLASASKRSSRLSSLMNSCSKVMQEMEDVVMHTNTTITTTQ
jgi:hypothetical protein